ncbi:MAG: hypothetical protein U0610_01960 [bacterium]
MNGRTLVRAVLVLVVLLGFIVGPGIWNRSLVLRHAAGFRRAELVVTGSACTGGQPEYDAQGHRTGTSPVHCTLRGTIDGTEQELASDAASIAAHPVGSRISVWFNPELPATGINHDSLRVRWGDVDDVGAFERRAVRTLAWILVLPAIFTILLNVLVRRAERFGAVAGAAQTFRIVTMSRQVAAGVPMMAVGLAFLWLQGQSVAWGGVVFGGLLAAAGALLASWQVIEIDRAARTRSRFRALGPLAFARRTEALPAGLRVGWAKRALASPSDRGEWLVELRGGESDEQLGAGRTVEVARDRARDLAAFLAVALEESPAVGADEMFPGTLDPDPDDAAGDGSGDRREPALDVHSLARLPPAPEQLAIWKLARAAPVLLLCAAVAGVALVPSIGGRVGRAVVDPLTGMPALRNLGLALMSRDRSDENVLVLLRLANCLDPAVERPVVVAALTALGKLGGEPFAAEGDLDTAIVSANRWAAARLGRSLDANLGVLGWYEPHPIVKPIIERIAGLDRNDAWVAWDHFGAGVLVTPSQFVCAAGPALGDARRIRFAIQRGSFSGYSAGTPPPFEGQPVPIEEYFGVALADTVGGALALELWTRQGVGDDVFPEDFDTWWSEWARAHRLPPLPPRWTVP